MSKRAGIYIRVSKEKQAEKASPQAQEEDCRTYCEERGYQVVDVYSDTQRYRAGSKMVEPSGTRNDRPEFNRMLTDADDGRIDVVIAWREDRLYRGVSRSMLEINDRVKNNIVGVELAKETYDATVAPVKAWAAGIELEAKQERFLMGLAARLESGKVWSGRPPYGYKRDGDYFVINPDEAQWVEKIFEWYGSGESVMHIRRWLISAGAKQRNDKVKYPWELSKLYKILSYEPYWTGKHIVKSSGKEYEIDIPSIVSPEVAEACRKRKEEYKQYPAGNLKTKTITAGLIYCHAHGTQMLLRSNTNGRTREEGTQRLKRYINYRCQANYTRGFREGCAKHMSVAKLDVQIWDKVWSIISTPGLLEDVIQQRIEEIQSQTVDAEADCQKLQRQLDELLLERQMVIGYARKNIITEEDLETQLIGITIQQGEIERQMEEAKLLMGNRAERLQELADMFREKVRTGFEELNVDQSSPELEDAVRIQKRKIVQAIVKRVDVFGDKMIKVHFLFDFPELVKEAEFVDISYPSLQR